MVDTIIVTICAFAGTFAALLLLGLIPGGGGQEKNRKALVAGIREEVREIAENTQRQAWNKMLFDAGLLNQLFTYEYHELAEKEWTRSITLCGAGEVIMQVRGNVLDEYLMPVLTHRKGKWVAANKEIARSWIGMELTRQRMGEELREVAAHKSAITAEDMAEARKHANHDSM